MGTLIMSQDLLKEVVLIMSEGSGLELWFSDEFPSSHKENVHIFFSQKEYKSEIYAFNESTEHRTIEFAMKHL